MTEMSEQMRVEELREIVVDALEELKCIDLSCMDVRKLTNLCDYMIVVSGNTQRQVKALTNNVLQRCRENQVRPLGVEGETSGEWVLIDLTDVVVHVMLPVTRQFYDLERLWGSLAPEDLSSRMR